MNTNSLQEIFNRISNRDLYLKLVEFLVENNISSDKAKYLHYLIQNETNQESFLILDFIYEDFFYGCYKFVARKPDVLALRMNGNKLAVTVNSI